MPKNSLRFGPDEYEIVQERKGYRVRTRQKKPTVNYEYRYFSKKPMSLENAEKQLEILTGFSNDRYFDRVKRLSKSVMKDNGYTREKRKRSKRRSRSRSSKRSNSGSKRSKK